ncbi:MAG: hypothetical protein ABI024_08380 [Vicinamibacterales bacterium]
MANEKVPRKYWWVVAVAVPVAVAMIAILPSLLKRSVASGEGTSATITGDNNTVSFDYSTHNTFVTSVNVIAREYELQTGRPLSDDLRQQIEAAVTAAAQSNHTESIRLLEQVAQAVPVPAIYNNLGVEYAKTKNPEASRRAFELSKAKIGEAAASLAKNRPLSAEALKPPSVSGAGVSTEASAVPAMTIDAVSPPYEAPGAIHVVAHGTQIGGSYEVKYQPQPGTTVVMEPGAYDVLLKVSSHGAGFVLASNVAVREGRLTRINPNALVGGIAVEPVSRKGFPLFKLLEFIDRGSGDKRLLAQQTDKLGVTLPIAPGAYDVLGTTTDDQRAELFTNLVVKAGQITKLDPLAQVAAITVHAPNVKGLDMKAVYALKAGTNQIAGKVEAWDLPMLVPGGVSYDVALEQAAGLTRIRKGITPGRGELVDVR